MRSFPGLSFWSYNNLNSDNWTENSLLNTNTSERFVHWNIWKWVSGSKWGRRRGKGEGRRAETDTTDAFLWVLKEGRNQVAICISCSPEEQRDTVNVPAGVVGTQCTKPSDWCRNEAQRCRCLVAPVVWQNKPWSLATFLHSSRGSSGPRRSYSCEHWAIKHIIYKL